MRRLYLDVDGVLLGKVDPSAAGVVLARHAGDFLEFALENFECWWLTTHCRGDAADVLRYLDPYCGAAVKILLPAVRPTSWRTLKTEALEGDFLWVDDAPLAVELDWLRDRGFQDRWIPVDTRRRPDDLRRALQLLKGKVTEES